MNCLETEECLSAYMESDLPALEMERVSRHLAQCPECTELLDAMRLTVDVCRNYPEPQMDPRLMDRILARTVARPASLSFHERLKQYVLQPVLTPRFAFGAGLAVLFFALAVQLMVPRMSVALASTSPSQVYTFMDRNVQRLYGEGLKAYEKKKTWQAEFSYFKNRMIGRLQYVMEKFDITDEGMETPVKPERREEKPIREKNTGLRLISA